MSLVHRGERSSTGLIIGATTLGLILAIIDSKPITITDTDARPKSTAAPRTIFSITGTPLLQAGIKAIVNTTAKGAELHEFTQCQPALNAIPERRPSIAFVEVNPQPLSVNNPHVATDFTCASRVQQALRQYSPSGTVCLVSNDQVPGDSNDRSSPFSLPNEAKLYMERAGYTGNVFTCVMPQNEPLAWQIVLGR